MRQIRFLAVSAGLLVGALIHVESAQAGDVYRYVDERGATMYTDKPMPGAVLVSAGSQRPPEVAQRAQATARVNTTTQLDASNKRIADNQTNQRAAESVAKDLEATRLDRCKKARANYDNAINSQRLYRDKEGGQREYLNDAELAQARVDARKAVDAICGPQG
jgi:hypothetical protein